MFIEQVKHTKFFGVIFDDNLDWSNHISYINSKIAKGIGIIYYLCSNKFIECIYCALSDLLCGGMVKYFEYPFVTSS